MQTVGDLIRTVLPGGTQVFAADVPPSGPTYHSCPIFPPDVFAVVGKLVELSGAYHHVFREGEAAPASKRGPGRLLCITRADVAWAETQGRAWRKGSNAGGVPKAVEAEWVRLSKFDREDLFKLLPVTSPPPAWWRPAMRLLMAADEASVGMGFDLAPAASGDSSGDADDGPTMSWVNALWRYLVPPRGGDPTDSRSRRVFSFSSADPNVVCVLPKVRTSGVGCSLRSLTHHLALLPPQGITRVWWLSAPEPAAASRRPLNVILIPYPFRISAKCFVPGLSNDKAGWGWFDLEQRWLAPDGVSRKAVVKEFVAFIIGVVQAAARDVTEVHGVVFPEFALDYELFRAVAEGLRHDDVGRHLEFFVSGTSGNGARKGNFVCTASFGRFVNDAGVVNTVCMFDDRQKHHRWRLDRYQISRYGLTSALDPDLLWWEDLPIFSRSISSQPLRGDSVFTSMICEDLARVDPCQEALRSIGPNLVFALLMDGPQLRTRWPGRYATILAEDPGCSVLTLSSMGLINRANASGQDQPSRVIALWKDVDVDRREIALDKDAVAVCLTLNSKDQEEFTLDGRSDGWAAAVWTLGSLMQVPAASVTPLPKWIDECR